MTSWLRQQVVSSLKPVALVSMLLVGGVTTVQAATILVLGDSISAAYGMAPQQGWVNLLQARLNTDPAFQKGRPHRVINASASGETSGGGLARLPALLKAHRPDVLVIELGGNDGLRGQPPALIAKQLTQMVRLGKQTGSKVILAGMRIPPNYGSVYTQAFHGLYSQVARQEKVTLVPFMLEGVGGNRSLMQADGIHPNQAAQPILLRNMLPAFKQTLQ